MISLGVALRKESVDRNLQVCTVAGRLLESLSARRAWIEIDSDVNSASGTLVALRKESVDRNRTPHHKNTRPIPSLSARRAWIEIIDDFEQSNTRKCRSPQGERG